MKLWSLSYNGIQIGEPIPEHQAIETYNRFSRCFKNLELAHYDPAKKAVQKGLIASEA